MTNKICGPRILYKKISLYFNININIKNYNKFKGNTSFFCVCNVYAFVCYTLSVSKK